MRYKGYQLTNMGTISYTTSQGPGRISTRESSGAKLVQIQIILPAYACTHMIAVGLWLAVLYDGSAGTVDDLEGLGLSNYGRVVSRECN
jgi:hypothetical protein